MYFPVLLTVLRMLQLHLPVFHYLSSSLEVVLRIFNLQLKQEPQVNLLLMPKPQINLLPLITLLRSSTLPTLLTVMILSI